MTTAKGFALVTGASWGIGAEFARQLAQDGYDLILTARSEDRLKSLQAELAKAGRAIHVIAADLTSPPQTRILKQQVQALKVDVELLVNNAGFGSGGSFAKHDIDRELSMIDLNVRALVELTHHFLLPMRQRGHGGIMNVASMAGFLPIPFMATYAATKAFVVSFSQAVYYENRSMGVHVMAVCPGSTDTNFFEAAKMKPINSSMQTSAAVVKEALRAYRKKKPVIVTGVSNKARLAAINMAPRALVLHTAANIMRKRDE